jgi:hypothetical protein
MGWIFFPDMIYQGIGYQYRGSYKSQANYFSTNPRQLFISMKEIFFAAVGSEGVLNQMNLGKPDT